jgi:isopentenyldiphosphate isomerase
MPDTSTELLDIYDDNLVWVGVKPRREVHRDGDWHRTFHCWVIRRDEDGSGHIIMQRRSESKATYPGYLDVSSAGHLLAGETAADGVRELEEELGLQVGFERLVPVGRRMTAYRFNDMIEREVADVFFCLHQQPLDAYQWQQEEVTGVASIPIDSALDLFSRKVASIQVDAVGLQAAAIPVTLQDFIPSLDQYVYKVYILAKRFLNGDEHLLV